MNACYKIPAENIPIVTQKIEKLNRKAVKLGMPGLTLNTRHSTLEDTQLYNWVELLGAAPSISGFEFLGKIERGNPTLLQSVPGQSIPREYYDTDSHCDHCNLSRARKNLYVVQDTKTGETQQIGSSCLGDFLRDAGAASRLMSYFTQVLNAVEMSDREFTTGGQHAYESTRHILSVTSAIIGVHGWVSRGAANEDCEGPEATANLVADYLYSRDTSARVLRAACPVTMDNLGETEQAIEWLIAQDSEDSNYLENLSRLIHSEYTEARRFGLLCSLIGTYRAHLARVARKQAREESKATAENCPEGRVQITGKILNINVKENEWGPRRVATIQDDRGFVVWGTLNIPANVGDRVTFKGTISVSSNDIKFGFYKRPHGMEAC